MRQPSERTVSSGQASALTRCPVCRDRKTRPFMSIDGNGYHRCGNCSATVLDPAHRLSPAEELAHYRHHENDVADPRYRAFLDRLAAPLMERLAPQSSGLDYGCGPGPALAAMLTEKGHAVALYDPFFAPDRAVLDEIYDFVTCTEVVEHFHEPADAFDRFDALVRPGGWVAVMTCFQTDDDRFARWHYRLDPTHVIFYRAETFGVIAAQRGWVLEIPVKDVALMRKPG